MFAIIYHSSLVLKTHSYFATNIMLFLKQSKKY